MNLHMIEQELAAVEDTLAALGLNDCPHFTDQERAALVAERARLLIRPPLPEGVAFEQTTDQGETTRAVMSHLATTFLSPTP